ncbi:MAG: Lrp/AsnC ligand binding domain-containing protein [Candidatus Brockarchaeota archaeon]|nr:Lrp/AsnC ligand binding domain-containing protein [Candidatus Brockarchaeota archaeon]
MKACVLLKCKPGAYRQVAKRIQSMSNVEVVFPTLGRWDVVLKIQARNIKDIANIVRKLRAIDEIEYSETLAELPGAG